MQVCISSRYLMSELYKHLNILAKMHEHICVKLDGIYIYIETTEILRDKRDARRRSSLLHSSEAGLDMCR
jgi:hypothetical protein